MKIVASRALSLLSSAALASLVFAPAAEAYWWNHGNKSSACKETARMLQKSCLFDLSDNYFETRAACVNIEDAGDRWECLGEAGDEIGEEAELCRDQRAARLEACDLLAEDRYDPDPLVDPAISFVDPNGVTEATKNPYVSIVAGNTFVLRAGEDGEEMVIVTATEDVREIQGVLCRVIVDVVVIEEEDGGEYEYLPVEATDDWFAQDTLQNVYYCGEVARNYDEEEGFEGVLRDLDGSFESGIDRAKGGLLLLAAPAGGEIHRQEYALAEAEDIVQYVALNTGPGAEEGGDEQAFPCNNGCLKTYDFTPLEPDGAEFKYWLPGTGFVLGVALDEDGNWTGEREERVCTGSSIDEVFANPDCEIGDADALREELCKLSPDAFCED